MKILNKSAVSAAKCRTQRAISRKGLIFIPDISGFTELVRSTDMATGRSITYELLRTIIGHNAMRLQIAEIEGDAVLFYKWEPLPGKVEIVRQFSLMKAAFDEARQSLEGEHNTRLDLELKAIAHYGTMTQYSLGGFEKLYGEVVIEAHRLLKNSIPDRSYLLITDELSAACARKNHCGRPDDEAISLCETTKGLGNICYTYTRFDQPIMREL